LDYPDILSPECLILSGLDTDHGNQQIRGSDLAILSAGFNNDTFGTALEENN